MLLPIAFAIANKTQLAHNKMCEEELNAITQMLNDIVDDRTHISFKMTHESCVNDVIAELKAHDYTVRKSRDPVSRVTTLTIRW